MGVNISAVPSLANIADITEPRTIINKKKFFILLPAKFTILYAIYSKNQPHQV